MEGPAFCSQYHINWPGGMCPSFQYTGQWRHDNRSSCTYTYCGQPGLHESLAFCNLWVVLDSILNTQQQKQANKKPVPVFAVPEYHCHLLWFISKLPWLTLTLLYDLYSHWLCHCWPEDRQATNKIEMLTTSICSLYIIYTPVKW